MENQRTSPPAMTVASGAAAAALVGLGLLNFGYGDLLLQWQPAPKSATWRVPMAWTSGVVLVAAGSGLVLSRTRRMAAMLGACWIALWVVALHIPTVIAMKGRVGAVLGVAECSAMALGLATLGWRFTAPRSRRMVVASFGACCIVFGVSHFAYAEFTAQMVPGWVPAHLAVAYLTGVVHALAGLCLVAGVAARTAAVVEAAMMTSFVALLHVPHVIAAPTDRLELTMLGIATLLTSAAWLVARFAGATVHAGHRGLVHRVAT